MDQLPAFSDLIPTTRRVVCPRCDKRLCVSQDREEHHVIPEHLAHYGAALVPCSAAGERLCQLAHVYPGRTASCGCRP